MASSKDLWNETKNDTKEDEAIDLIQGSIADKIMRIKESVVPFNTSVK
jgi:hypothetical protein